MILSSLAQVPAAARWRSRWHRRASGFCFSSAATIYGASRTTGTLTPCSCEASTKRRSLGTTVKGELSIQGSTISSAATRRSTAAPCSGYGHRTSRKSSTPTGCRRLGRSGMPNWSLITPLPSACSTCMACAGLTLQRAGRVRPTPIRLSATSRASRRCATPWNAKATTHFRSRSRSSWKRMRTAMLRNTAPVSAVAHTMAFPDAQIICVDPALGYKNVTLMTGAYVDRLETDPRGHTVTGVHVRIGDELATYHAEIVVVAAGALSSSLLMFRSANTAHPAGLANGSDQVGRNYMRHNNSAFMAVSREPNDTTYQKTMALNDFYFGADDWEYPLGGIQTLGKSHGAVIKAEALPQFLSWFPDMPFDTLARHALDFWLMSEDLPRPENRIELKPEGRVVLTINPTSDEALRRLRHKLEVLLSKVDVHPHLLERSLYLGKNVPIGGTAHQAGTMRFGTDPASSVLDTNCKAHQLDNLYVTDAGFFPSI